MPPAVCCAEETDSEGEQQGAAATHSQLILANAKGPTALSYRRIIFGTDGRLRPQYSEKNRHGFGLFRYALSLPPLAPRMAWTDCAVTFHAHDSFSEAQRQGSGEGDADDYVEPTRTVTYWASSAYDCSRAHDAT